MPNGFDCSTYDEKAWRLNLWKLENCVWGVWPIKAKTKGARIAAG